MDGMVGLASGQIIYQDFKHRTGSIYVLVLLAIVAGVMAFNNYPAYPVLNYFSVNVSFLAIVGLVQSIMIFIKKKQLLNPLNKVIGLFDVLYLVILCACFSPRNFLFFIIFAAMLGTLHGFFYQIKLKIKKPSIPFAAYLAISHLIFLVVKYSTGISLYNDSLIKNLFSI